MYFVAKRSIDNKFLTGPATQSTTTPNKIFKRTDKISSRAETSTCNKQQNAAFDVDNNQPPTTEKNQKRQNNNIQTIRTSNNNSYARKKSQVMMLCMYTTSSSGSSFLRNCCGWWWWNKARLEKYLRFVVFSMSTTTIINIQRINLYVANK